ncbi:TetR family transcriptional regulator [Nocardioides sp. AE5]|uniref:TetR/AcrR family transcriptional regulator n=1 Tax=Nocardioides sp. AE5 TaxID=2962573 RepID=UPI00288172AA|nr:TetR family transcriptional regulator [Nocardioides sp. AE5]MDT0202618.1 TetR family transcriptional regulator [Nocardioides sp. AE5]
MGASQSTPEMSAIQSDILAAALHCLVTFGYAGTTTVAVQREAKVSRGSLLHYYPRREDLLVGAARRAMNLWLDEMELRVEDLRRLVPDDAHRLEPAIRLRWHSFHNPVHGAFAELWTASRYNEELRDAVLRQERANRARVEACDARLFGTYADHPSYSATLLLLHTSMRGRAESYALVERDWDHDPMIKSWTQLARTVLET